MYIRYRKAAEREKLHVYRTNGVAKFLKASDDFMSHAWSEKVLAFISYITEFQLKWYVELLVHPKVRYVIVGHL